jgi:hypothetical protein
MPGCGAARSTDFKTTFGSHGWLARTLTAHYEDGSGQFVLCLVLSLKCNASIPP